MKKFIIELEKLDQSDENSVLSENITTYQKDKALWTDSYQASGKEGEKPSPPPPPGPPQEP